MHSLPMGLATLFAMALFAFIGMACWALGRKQAFMDAPDQNHWVDLIIDSDLELELEWNRDETTEEDENDEGDLDLEEDASDVGYP